MEYSIPKLLGTSKAVNYKTEILSGLTVALALVPEAIAFAMIAGISPLTGLYAAFVMGFVTSILGGATCYDFWSNGSNSRYFCQLNHSIAK